MSACNRLGRPSLTQPLHEAAIRFALASLILISSDAMAATRVTEATMSKLWWLWAVVMSIGLLLGGRWVLAAREANARQAQAAAANAKAREQLAVVKSEQGRREYVLEVVNLGVTLDKYRQGKLWDALQSGNPYTSLRDHDPKKYPWASNDKLGMRNSSLHCTATKQKQICPSSAHVWYRDCRRGGVIRDDRQSVRGRSCPSR